MFNRRFESMRAAYTFIAALVRSIIARRCWAASSLFRRRLAGSGSLDRQRFLPHRGFRRRCACTRAPLRALASKRPSSSSRAVEDEIRHVMPPSEIDTIIDNIGIPNGSFNLAFGDSPTIGVSDGDILISLKPEEHGSTAEYTDRLRKRLNDKFPGRGVLLRSRQHHQPDSEFRTAGAHRRAGGGPQRRRELRDRPQIAAKSHAHSRRGGRAHSPGGGLPRDPLNVDRDKAGQVGLTQRDVANSLLISLSSQRTDRAHPVARTGRTGVSYSIGRADAAIPHGFAGRADAYTDSAPFASVNSTTQTSSAGSANPTNAGVGTGPSQASARLRQSRRGRKRPAACSRIWRPWAAASPRRSSTTTMCSRCSMSTPTSTAGISAAWARPWRRSSRR